MHCVNPQETHLWYESRPSYTYLFSMFICASRFWIIHQTTSSFSESGFFGLDGCVLVDVATIGTSSFNFSFWYVTSGFAVPSLFDLSGNKGCRSPLAEAVALRRECESWSLMSGRLDRGSEASRSSLRMVGEAKGFPGSGEEKQACNGWGRLRKDMVLRRSWWRCTSSATPSSRCPKLISERVCKCSSNVAQTTDIPSWVLFFVATKVLNKTQKLHIHFSD